MEILKVKNLCKNYGKGNTLVKALDNVSFSVEKGEDSSFTFIGEESELSSVSDLSFSGLWQK